MPEIIKVYRESLPAVRLIGKRYTDADRVNGSFGAKWGEWFQNGWFSILEKLVGAPDMGGDFLGCMRCPPDSPFEYWIGMFLPAGASVPEGMEYADIPAGDIGVCWIYGSDENGEIYGEGAHNACYSKIVEAGWAVQDNPWFFERYNCQRFNTKDERGNVILDYAFYLK